MAKADPTDFFWTDAQQAAERISRSCVVYDGQPFYVETIEPHDDGIPRARMRPCGTPDGAAVRKMLTSPKFNRFRTLPNLGWMNNYDNRIGASFLARRTMTTRTHGLNSNNVMVGTFVHGELNSTIRYGDYSISNMMFDKGFVESHNDDFPPLEKTLAVIKEGTSIAFSRLYCVFRDRDGLRWMYRNTDRVGVFTGVDTLNLISKYSYLREEIMASPSFTINNLREF